MALPDFLVVGAPKAGTTALHVALSQHPQIFMSSPKEPKYFLTDDGVQPVQRGGPGDAQTISRQVWRRADYEALFDASPSHALKGESSTLYLHDRAAHRRIAATLPDARLVAVLRDPVDRAHSNWTHLRSAGLEPERDFVRATELSKRAPMRAGRRSGATSGSATTARSSSTSSPCSRASRCSSCSTGTCASSRSRHSTRS